MKNAYLFQPQYTVEVSQVKNYWLPYSAGCLWSYAQQFEDIRTTWHLGDIIYRREPPQDVLDRLEDPAYCGFSCYVWNRTYCLMLADMIKQRWPSCVIQFGGPESSGRMLEHDFIDSISMAEGEENFVATLRGITAGQATPEIFGKTRLQDLDIPSPYLTGVFDSIMQRNPDVDWAMTLETNRGCPFACTFCDWGGVTYSKIKKFKLERVAQELEWCTQHRVAFIFCADANFGAFRERDITIAKMIRSAADRGHLQAINLQYAKNSTETVFEIARIVGDISRGVTISMQSMNPDTLEAIKRTNLEVNNIRRLMDLSRRSGVGSYTEMIIGLPEETLQSWKTGMTELLELGQHYSIDVWFAQLLENSELNSAETRQRYKIGSVRAQDYLPYRCPDDYAGATEIVELINETSTMTTADIVEGYMYAMVIVNFHVGGYSQVWARYCRDVLGVSYRRFYDCLYAALFQDEVMKQHFGEMINVTEQYMRTGVMPDSISGGHALHNHSQEFLFNNRSRCYDLADKVAIELGADLHAVAELQRHFVYDPDSTYPTRVKAAYDLDNSSTGMIEYVVDSRIDRTVKLNFYRERRRGLLKNQLTKIS